MASYNRVTILGNLGRDPELRYTQNKTAFTALNVATTEFRNSTDGTKQSFTDWHRVVVWGRQAENCSKYLRKGQPVFIEGRLRTRSWEGQGGQKNQVTEVVASLVQFLGQQNEKRGATTNESPQQQSMPANDPILNGPSNNSIDEVPF